MTSGFFNPSFFDAFTTPLAITSHLHPRGHLKGDNSAEAIATSETRMALQLWKRLERALVDRMMPPKMFTKIDFTFGSFCKIVNAATIWSSWALPHGRPDSLRVD